MRNLLMTKLGTPTGAGPGRPSVNVGLSRVGDPSGRRIAPGFVRLRFFGVAGSPSSRNSPGDAPGSVSGLSAVSSPPLLGAGALGETGPPSSTFWIGALSAGSWIASGGVPGGTSTVVTTSWPPTRVMVIVRSSASAGNDARLKPATKMVTVSTPKRIFRVIPCKPRLALQALPRFPHQPPARGPYRKRWPRYLPNRRPARLDRLLHAGKLRRRQSPASIWMPPTGS